MSKIDSYSKKSRERGQVALDEEKSKKMMDDFDSEMNKLKKADNKMKL